MTFKCILIKLEVCHKLCSHILLFTQRLVVSSGCAGKFVQQFVQNKINVAIVTVASLAATTVTATAGAEKTVATVGFATKIGCSGSICYCLQPNLMQPVLALNCSHYY